MKSDVYVVSDLHIAAAGPLNNFHAGKELTDFLDSLPGNSRLIVNGDGFDFLKVPGRTRHLDLEGSPQLVASVLAEIARSVWGRGFQKAWRNFLKRGGRSTLIPGNHDPEWYYPETERVLREFLNLSPSDDSLSVHRGGEPWRQTVGEWTVVVGHGCQRDPWNSIPVDAIHAAVRKGVPVLDLPLGSLLVIDTLNAFSRAADPRTGKARFPFMDSLKPDVPAVPLLLLYLDQKLTLSTLPGASPLLVQALIREVAMRLRSGRRLDAGGGKEGEGMSIPQALALAIADSEKERGVSADAASQLLSDFFADAAPTPPGSLATHGGGAKMLLRAWLRAISREQGDGFFDPGALGFLDQQIISGELEQAQPRTIVLAGHTHARREYRLDGDRVYLNTGTWSDLIDMPVLKNDTAARAWIDRLEAGETPRRRILTYAVVSSDGARLKTWPSGGDVAINS